MNPIAPGCAIVTFGLIETRVVFELAVWTFNTSFKFRLIETRVVFEYTTTSEGGTDIEAINRNKSCI